MHQRLIRQVYESKAALELKKKNNQSFSKEEIVHNNAVIELENFQTQQTKFLDRRRYFIKYPHLKLNKNYLFRYNIIYNNK